MLSEDVDEHKATQPVPRWRQVIRAGIAATLIGFITYSLMHEVWYRWILSRVGDPPLSNPQHATYWILAIQTWSWAAPFLGGMVAGLMLGWLGVPVGIGATGLWVGVLMFLRGWARALRYQTASILHNEALVLLLAFAPGAAVGAVVGAWLRSRISKKTIRE